MLPLPVMAAVLCGAALHAGWNVGVRAGADRRRETALLVGGATAIAVLALPFLAQPRAAAWPFLVASASVHVGYFSLVAAAYSQGGVMLAYPLMRGTAPALTAVAALLLLGETLPWPGWLGVAAVCSGVLLLAQGNRRGDGRAVALALLNAGVIATYTLIDGTGVRASAAPLAYTLWLYVLTSVPTLLALQRERGLLAAWPNWREVGRGLVAGGASIASYALALWAMTEAPVAPVAALRETAMLFGLVFARVFLGERPGRRRWAAAMVIALGAALLHFG